ncbi:hypothetical protein [Arthrobacter antibioticus]|uniref:hypothetical protein n=1 Tax=Arthrobacter sp. H35-MC1 TaxID=3046203 RepID=UPI0024BA805A|nr:hypothetical protein [Arthrobacter sp. H35-MC1]MDJ0317323.1 hypothetical protein [Arthrobacter sp. H35-MC1]
MSKHPDDNDKDLINGAPAGDPLTEAYTGMVSPDIEEINEHAASRAKEDQVEPDSM